MIVKRLVAIEDLGNIDVFFTDKTGTLTEGRSASRRARRDAAPRPTTLLRDGLLCNEAVVSDGQVGRRQSRSTGALAGAGRASTARRRRARRLACAAVRLRAPDRVRARRGRRTERGRVIVKGAPELVLARCRDVPPPGAVGARRAVRRRQPRRRGRHPRRGRADDAVAPTTSRASSWRASSPSSTRRRPTPPPRSRACAALGVEVKVITGDNDRVAAKVCADLGLERARRAHRRAARRARRRRRSPPRCPSTTIFARVTPEQKSRVINAQRALGSTVGFMGDGVNDAVALHDADVGISVDTATDVAKDAADIVLLEKDLGILAGRHRRGPPHLRQHDQVRADGHVVELREHVQRRRPRRSSSASCRCCRRRSCSTTCSTTRAR